MKRDFLEEEQMEELEEESSWDFRKIFAGFLTIGILGIGIFWAKDTYLSQYFPHSRNGEVQGVSTEADDPEKYKMSIPTADNLQSAVEDKMTDIRKQLSELSPEDVASSSPSVKKLLQDIEGIKQYPQNQVKETCMNFCSRL